MLLSLRLLNDNLLEGRVPEELYSIGVRGGAIEYVVISNLMHTFQLLHTVAIFL